MSQRPRSPTLNTPASLGAKVGEEVEIALTGTNLTDPTAVLLSCPAKVTIPTDNKNGTEAGKLRVKVAVDPKCPIGLYTVRVATKHGISNARPFVVDFIRSHHFDRSQPHKGHRPGGHGVVRCYGPCHGGNV